MEIIFPFSALFNHIWIVNIFKKPLQKEKTSFFAFRSSLFKPKKRAKLNRKKLSCFFCLSRRKFLLLSIKLSSSVAKFIVSAVAVAGTGNRAFSPCLLMTSLFQGNSSKCFTCSSCDHLQKQLQFSQQYHFLFACPSAIPLSPPPPT